MMNLHKMCKCGHGSFRHYQDNMLCLDARCQCQEFDPVRLTPLKTPDVNDVCAFCAHPRGRHQYSKDCDPLPSCCLVEITKGSICECKEFVEPPTKANESESVADGQMMFLSHTEAEIIKNLREYKQSAFDITRDESGALQLKQGE